MAKLRILYIWEGPDTVCITKGNAMDRIDTPSGVMYRGKIKHRGFFRPFIPVENIRDVFFSEPKRLFVNNRTIDNWSVIRIKLDYATREPYITDIPAHIMAKLNSLQTELEIWKNRCLDAEDKLYSIDNKDRFIEKMKRDLKFAGEARNLIYGQSYFGGYDYPFASRWGIGGVPLGQSSPQQQE